MANPAPAAAVVIKKDRREVERSGTWCRCRDDRFSSWFGDFCNFQI